MTACADNKKVLEDKRARFLAGANHSSEDPREAEECKQNGTFAQFTLAGRPSTRSLARLQDSVCGSRGRQRGVRSGKGVKVPTGFELGIPVHEHGGRPFHRPLQAACPPTSALGFFKLPVFVGVV